MTRARRILQWWGLDPRQFAETNDAWLDPADAEPWEDPRPWLPKASGTAIAVVAAAVLLLNVGRAAAQGDDLDFCPVDDPAPVSCITVDGLLLDSDGVVIADLGSAAELGEDGWAIIDGDDDTPAPAAPKPSTPQPPLKVTVDTPKQPGPTRTGTDAAATPGVTHSPPAAAPGTATYTVADPLTQRIRIQLAKERRVFRARLATQTRLANALRVQLVKERRLRSFQCVIGGAR